MGILVLAGRKQNLCATLIRMSGCAHTYLGYFLVLPKYSSFGLVSFVDLLTDMSNRFLQAKTTALIIVISVCSILSIATLRLQVTEMALGLSKDVYYCCREVVVWDFVLLWLPCCAFMIKILCTCLIFEYIYIYDLT